MKKFDVVIIGTGLGGLVAATILSKNNYSVCLIEKNEQFGGALQIFKRDGVALDTGVHYIGALGKGENLHQFFKYLGLIDRLKLKKMDEDGFDKISFGDSNEAYPWANGYENFESKLIQFFPNEKKAIEAYTKAVKETCDSLGLYNLNVPEAPDFNASYNTLNIYDFLKSLTTNEKLVSVLLGNNLLYYADKQNTPFYVHALIVNSYILSAWRCVDGGHQIAHILVRIIKNNGGKFIRKEEVVSIEVNDGMATSVSLKGGMKIFGTHFISNINPAKTLDLLEGSMIRPAYKNRIKRIENSISAFTMHLILKENSFPYFNHNHYHFTGNNVWCNSDYKEENWPENLMIFTPASNNSSEFAASISIMSSMKFNEVAKWAHTGSTTTDKKKREEDYLSWKAIKEQKILEVVLKLYPSLKDNIVSIHSSTPLTYRDYLHTNKGSTYGSKKSCENPLESYISPRTKIPNLHLTGQDVNLHGVLGVTITAFLTCASFVDITKLLKEVREA